jgi:hypothetical protein
VGRKGHVLVQDILPDSPGWTEEKVNEDNRSPVGNRNKYIPNASQSDTVRPTAEDGE